MPRVKRSVASRKKRRKVLADLAVSDPIAFGAIAEKAKAALQGSAS